ncbi:hypothetical protein M569_13844 [Genlisea aurea]|uniref:Uncharacterized protein n=1 Tax=Genlisea aurea TaxID=192259 RepID=S8DMR2_9LAMI|nr:hypothetical protein M569_13844 [Genlisea aurea]
MNSVVAQEVARSVSVAIMQIQTNMTLEFTRLRAEIAMEIARVQSDNLNLRSELRKLHQADGSATALNQVSLQQVFTSSGTDKSTPPNLQETVRNTRVQDLPSTIAPLGSTNVLVQVKTSPTGGFSISPNQSFGNGGAKQSYTIASLHTTDPQAQRQVFCMSDTSGSTELSKILQPKWNGDRLSWTSFLREWECYWSHRAKEIHATDDAKSLVFLECLAGNEFNEARTLLLRDSLAFDELIQHFERRILPRISPSDKFAHWKQLLPEDNSTDGFESWFMLWCSRAQEIPDLTQREMITQFKEVITQYHPKTLKAFIKLEFKKRMSKETLTLKEVYDYILDEIIFQEHLQTTQQVAKISLVVFHLPYVDLDNTDGINWFEFGSESATIHKGE